MMSDARGIIRKVIQLFAGPLGWRSSPVKVTLSIAPSPLAGSHLITAICSPESQVTRVEFYIDSVLKTPADTSPPFTYLFNTTTVGDGPHWVEAVAYFDRNKKASVKQQVTVQNAPGPTGPGPGPQDIPVNTAVPTINDTTPTQGQTLTASEGGWTNSPDPTRYLYQWLRGTAKTPIPTATGKTYTCGLADVNEVLRVAVTAQNIVGPSEPAESAATTAVAGTAGGVPVLNAGGTPLVTGTPVQGNTLQVSNGSWTNSPTDYDYQWERCSVSPSASQVLDAFNRANVGPPPSGSWTDWPGLSGLVVISNQLAASGAGYRGAYWNTSVGPDCLVFADLATKPSTQNYLELHIKVANPGATRDSYYLELGGHSNNVRVYKSAGGVNTQLGTTDASQVWASGDGIGLSALGSTITVWRRAGASGTWTAILTRTDSTYANVSGKLGVIIDGQGWRLDNVGGGSLACGDVSGATAQSYVLTSADVGSQMRAEVTAINASGSSTPADSALTAAVTPTAPGPEPAPNAYWNETFESGGVGAGWLTERNIFGVGDVSKITIAYVADPLGQRGTVLRLRCAYDPTKPTDHSGNGRQLASLYRGAGQAHSGYNTINEETWYRTKFMALSGNVFADGLSNFYFEWHTDDSTQSMDGGSGNSPANLIGYQYPLTSDGTTTPAGLLCRWNTGSPGGFRTITWWPSSDGSGNESALRRVPWQSDHWYDIKFRVIWSTNPNIGRVEWWVDGVQYLARTMATLYTNPALPGGAAYMNFGLYNYRYNVTGDSSLYFDSVVAGPTEASIGG